MIQFIQKLFTGRQEKIRLTEEQKEAALEEKRAKLAKQREEYQARKRFIDDYVEKRHNEQRENSQDYFKRKLKKVEEANSTCPKCGSKNVINVFQRIKGELDGSIAGGGSFQGSSGLFRSSFNGSSHTSGKIHGELDTHEVLKCKDCGNEWKKEEAEYPTTHYMFSVYNSVLPRYFTRRLIEYFELKYNPKDLNETVYSLEEKRQKYLEDTRNSHFIKELQGTPIEVLEWMVCSQLIHEWSDEPSLGFDYDRDEDPYLYRFPNLVRDIAEYLTKKDEG